MASLALDAEHRGAARVRGGMAVRRDIPSVRINGHSVPHRGEGC